MRPTYAEFFGDLLTAWELPLKAEVVKTWSQNQVCRYVIFGR